MTKFIKTKSHIIRISLVASAIFFLLFVFPSCKKTGNVTYDTLNHEVDFVKKFFKTKTTPSAEIAAIIETLKIYNDRTGFVNKLPINCGLPIWEKVLIQKKGKNSSSNFNKINLHGPNSNFEEEIGGISDEENLIIPLTLNNTNLSSLINVESSADTFNINCYTTNGYLFTLTHVAPIDTATAMRNLSAFFCLENYTFGTTTFYNIPANLFSKSTVLDDYGTKTITIENNPVPTPNLAITVCHTVCCSVCNGTDSNCPLGGCWQDCTTYDSGGGDGGGGCIWCPPPGGGGNGGGGGIPCTPILSPTSWYNSAATPSPCGDVDENGNPLDGIFTTQKNLVAQWKNIIANEGNLRKGNFGEIASDVVLQQKGYIPIHSTRIVDINRQSHQGVDGLFKKGNYYFIVEAKYSQDGTYKGPDSGPPQQMSTTWLNGVQTGGVPPNPNSLTRIQLAANYNANLGNQIIASNPTRLIANTKPDGTVIYYNLIVDANGNVTKGSVFNP